MRRLKTAGRIHLHLDLVAGLPGESYADILAAIDRVITLQPDHLQLEPVKLLPGTPLRDRANALGLRFDPNPPYTVLATPELTCAELERLRAISRLLDLTYNAGCFPTFLGMLAETSGSLARGLEHLAGDLADHPWLRHPLGREGLFLALAEAVARCWGEGLAPRLREALAYDLARCERIIPERAAALFDTVLSDEERGWVNDEVRTATAALRGQGGKLQHFAAVFHSLPGMGGRTICLFLYTSARGQGLTVAECRFSTGTLARPV